MSSKSHRGRGGFTVLELLTVIVIMFILMGMVGGAYYSMGRGAAIVGAAENLRTTLSLARQFAMTHRRRTWIVFSQDGTNATYTVLAQCGFHAGLTNSAQDLVVPTPRPDWYPNNCLRGGTIYNITDGSRGTVSANTQSSVSTSGGLTGGTDNDWDGGDRAGWEVFDPRALPKNVVYGQGRPQDAPAPLGYNPDGSDLVQPGWQIELRELKGNTGTALRRVLTVSGITGKVTVSP